MVRALSKVSRYVLDADLHQVIGVLDTVGARQDRQVRVLVADLGGQLRGALRVVDGQHEELCRAGAGGVQQVEARCIPVKHLEAETSQGRDLVRVEVEDL